MVARGPNNKSIQLNIVDSSRFGRYPKIDNSHTYNLFISDSALVDYPGYQIGIPASNFNDATEGRALFYSSLLNRIVGVFDNNVYLINLDYDQQSESISSFSVSRIGQLESFNGIVYISENNKPQILFSDGLNLYLYDTTATPAFQKITVDFTPGYITFHDTYFIAAATNDQSSGSTQNNTWRLSLQNDGSTWPSIQAGVSYVGIIETKPDVTQAVLRFPSKGSEIFVMGKTVTEAWFDTGTQIFPYQRTSYMNIDYGCVSPATVCYLDEYVVWLASNERSGPIIMVSNGGMPEKITTDGIDYQFSQLQSPQDSQGFLYRQDGHLIYHINFYTDNQSYFYDFNTKKIYQASDQNMNYYAMSGLVFFKNQYFSFTRNDGNFYIFDTTVHTYDAVDGNGNVQTYEIPRIRTCNNVRLPSQDYFIINDVGFTIESGNTSYHIQNNGPISLITEDGHQIETQDGNNVLIAQQNLYLQSTPRVDLSISYDGGATFGQDMPYILPSIGQRKNKLQWWQLGVANDAVMQFKFWGYGRWVCLNGIVNIRT